MSESKLFKSIVLTLVMYGFISFLQWGKFLVPLPAFELVILGICLYFAWLEWKENKTIAGAFILFGITQFLGRDYNLAYFLSDETLQDMSQSIFGDISLLLSALFLTILYWLQNNRLKRNVWLYSLLGMALCASLILPYRWFVLIPLGLICLSFILEKNMLEKRHSIWAYLLVFAVCKELTLQVL